MNSPDAILVGDLHLMERVPECRTDAFFETLCEKLDWLRKLQRKYNIPVLCSGDIFDKWNPSHFLVDQAIINLPQSFYCVAGQHDLPGNSMKFFYKSALRVLTRTYNIHLLTDISYGLLDPRVKYD